MDPISQACFGASLSQSLSNNKASQMSAMVIGALAGMAPDLDVLIYSSHDPLLFLEFHRQFTHSLFFIPFGALICALFFYAVLQTKCLKATLSFKQVYIFSFLGYATHGLLDACTSYGTQLYWPFSNARIAWDSVSIIDPLFTLPVIFLVVLAVLKNKTNYARAGFIWAVVYLSAGLIQNHRAETAAYELAQLRGHQIERLSVKPSFGSRHLWKSIYEYKGEYYVDAIKLLWSTEFYYGTSVKKLNIQRDYPWENSNIIMDVRYSFLPNTIKLMWGIKLSEQTTDKDKAEAHVEFDIRRNLSRKTRNEYIDMLF